MTTQTTYTPFNRAFEKAMADILRDPMLANARKVLSDPELKFIVTAAVYVGIKEGMDVSAEALKKVLTNAQDHIP